MPDKQIHDVPLDGLTAAPQIRRYFDEDSLVGLAQTIREVGILEPLLARRDGDDLIILDGERRWRAARLAGLVSVPVIIIEEKVSGPQIAQRQLIANCQREDLTPIKKASAIEQLMQESHWSATQAAAKLGMSMATVSRSLTLLTLPDSVRQGVEAGAIPASAAYELARIENPLRQAELAAELVEGRVTRDGIVGVRKASSRRCEGAPSNTSDSVRITAMLDAGRTVTLAGHGLGTVDVLIQWLEELLSKARKARPQGLELKTFLRMLKDQAKA